MFEHHFGLRENPFPAGHQLKFVYPSREHQEAQAHLRYGIENREPFLLITGEVGTGKTTSLYDALNEWGDRVSVALITNSALTRQEMLEEICLRFGLNLPSGVSKPAALVALEKHLVTVRARGEHAVLMLDEAQNLSMELLEEIRLLSNLEHKGEKLLQIFLVGQPELEAHLARHELRQLRQRITVHYRLNPLSPDETLGYIHHHINVAGGNGAVVFPADTCREIYRLTHGIPREINTLSSAALIAAYADNSPSVQLAHVVAVAHEGDFKSVLSSPSTKPMDSTPPPARMAALMPPPEPVAQTPPPAPRPAAPEPAAWHPFQQPVGHTPLPAPAPPPQAAEGDPYVPRERGEVTRGLLAAMRRADAPPPPPAQQQQQRPMYAQPPMAQPPMAQPPPMYAQSPMAPAPAPPPPMYAQSPMAPPPPPPPRPAPIPLPVQRVVPMPPHMAAPQRVGQADLAGLPPRLRERLERELAHEESGASPVRNGLIAISVFATLVIMLVLMQRFGAIDVPFLRGVAGTRVPSSTGEPLGVDGTDGTSSKTALDPTAALIDSLKREVEKARRTPAVRTASAPESVGRPARAQVATPDNFKPDAATPVPVAAANTLEPAASTTPPDANESHFGVGVAAYLDADRARVEKDRLSRDTTLPGQVVPFRDGGTTMYRVVVGRWSTSGDAEKAANALMERGLINEARVVQIPKR